MDFLTKKAWRQFGRKRACRRRMPMLLTLMPNQRWSLDPRQAHSDQWHSHESIAGTFRGGRAMCLVADTGILGAGVARELDALFETYGKPACIVSENGSGLTRRTILKWTTHNDVAWNCIDPGKPQRVATSLSSSTAACAVNFQIRISFIHWTMRAARSPSGATSTTLSDRPFRPATKRPSKCAGHLCILMAPRQASLPWNHPPTTNLKPTGSKYEQGGHGGAGQTVF